MIFKRRDAYDEYYADEMGGSGRRFAKPRMFWHYLVLILVSILIVGVVGLTSGKTMLVKLLSSLVEPVGLIWICLFVSAYTLTISRMAIGSLLAWLAWLLLSLGGNSFVSSQLVRTLEQPYLDSKPLEEEPFDAIIVLGGGTTTSPNGVPQVSLSGDRVLLAARLIEAGKTKRVLCTGTDWRPLVGNDQQICEESGTILLEFAGQEVQVVRIKGENTDSEMESLEIWLQDHPQPRLGLITSAWHMPRALRLAKLYNIDVVPLPADFRTTRFRPDPNLLVPGADHLHTSGRVVHEYVAKWAGQ